MIRKTILEDKNIFIVLLIYAFLLIFFCSMMSPLYPINDWSDINLYFNVGKAMFNGKTLYTEVFDHKGPFIFIIYGFGYLLSNTSFLGMYIIESTGWAFMIFAGYLTARLYVDRIYAFLVAVIFPVLVLSHTTQGGSAEEFIIIFETISLFLFISYFKNKEASVHKPLYMLVHGLMCAMTLFTKINLTAFWIFPLLAIFINLLLKKEYRNLIQNIVAFIIGLLIIALPICIYLYANNALGEAWYTYITLNRRYAKIEGMAEILVGFATQFYLRLRFDTFEFLIILLGAIYFSWKYLGNKFGKIAITMSFFTLYAAIFVTPGFVYYYSIPYYVYALSGCIVLCKFIRLPSNRYIYIIIATLSLVWGIKSKNLFGLHVSELFGRNESRIPSNPFTNIIRQEKSPTLMSLGLDDNNVIFTELNIVPSVRYFVTPNLGYDIYPEMRDTQTKYIENKEVQFIILPQGIPNFDYFVNLPALSNNYRLTDKFTDEENNNFYLYKRIDD